MANKLYEEADIQAIADAIRYVDAENLDATYTTKEMSGALIVVYGKALDLGYAEGYSVGHAEGFDEGHKQGVDELDAFISDNISGDYYNDRIIRVGAYAFAGRQGITSLYLPNLTSAYFSICNTCTKLVRAYLPNFTTQGTSNTQNHFNGCYKLEFVDYGLISSLDYGAFSSCNVLKAVVLRNTEVVSLYNVSVFSNTPYANGGTGGKIYVPATLIEEYKVATNWSALYAYGTVEFVALEGSEYENADY